MYVCMYVCIYVCMHVRNKLVFTVYISVPMMPMVPVAQNLYVKHKICSKSTYIHTYIHTYMQLTYLHTCNLHTSSIQTHKFG